MTKTPSGNRRRWLKVLGLVGLLIASGCLITLYMISANLKKSHAAVKQSFSETLQSATPRFIEDQQQLSAVAFFQPSVGQQDASVYLSQLQQEGRLKLPEDLNFQDIKSALTLKTADLDFSWMQALANYDHILIVKDPRVAQQLEAKPYTLPALLELPPLTPYRDWYRLRILQGIQQGDMSSALRDARQLAYLMLNSETLIHALVGVGMLQWEREAYDVLAAEGKAPPDWQPFAADLLASAKRAYPAAGAFSMVGLTPPELMQQVLTDPNIRAGICGGLMESSLSLALYGFFPERKADIQQLKDLIARRRCHHSAYLNTLWADPEKSSEQMLLSIGDARSVIGPAASFVWLPFVRRSLGYTLEAIAVPNLLSGYAENPA